MGKDFEGSMAYTVRLSDFEGPLDLLLHLISRAKVKIEDIFVSEITEQYLESIEDLSGLDMDTASEFLQMAATLLEIKSRALLPKPPKEEEEDPREVLIRRLEEYKAIKEAGQELRAYEAVAGAQMTRLPMELVTETRVELKQMSLGALQEAFITILLRAQKEAEVPAPRRIARDSFTVVECMTHILTRLERENETAFDALFENMVTRDEIVTTFLAMLELLKANRISISQNGLYEPIMIRKGKGGEGNGES